MNNRLDFLGDNKTVIFYSPIEGSETLVRTGSLRTENSFIHAVLTSYSQDYLRMNEVKKTEYLETFLNKVKVKNNCTDLPTLVKEIYRYVLNDDRDYQSSYLNTLKKELFAEKKYLEIYKIILELIPETQLIATIQKLKNIETNRTETIFTPLETAFKNNKITDSKYVNIGCEKFQQLVSRLELYDEFKIDREIINSVSDIINRDIYTISSSDRLPYKFSKIKRRKAIILLSFEASEIGSRNATGNILYESVGKLLPEHRVQREFLFDDSIIKTIYTYLFEPHKIKKKYPNLLQYVDNLEEESSRRSQSPFSIYKRSISSGSKGRDKKKSVENKKRHTKKKSLASEDNERDERDERDERRHERRRSDESKYKRRYHRSEEATSTSQTPKDKYYRQRKDETSEKTKKLEKNKNQRLEKRNQKDRKKNVVDLLMSTSDSESD